MNELLKDPISLMLLIVTVVAIFSPIVTALISNHHNYKIKKLEYNNTVKKELMQQVQKVYLEYLDALAYFAAKEENYGGNFTYQIQFRRKHQAASFFVSKATRDKLETINSLVLARDYYNLKIELKDISGVLSAEIDKLKYNEK